MSPNGRRRWRRLAKAVRHREPGCFSREPGHGASLRRHPRHLEHSPPPPPAKPFDSRSIVGMSQSARKRKARAVAYRYIADVTMLPTAEQIATKADAVRFRECGFPRHDYDRAEYAMVRARYGIGERLRPCPGDKHILWRTRRWVPSTECKICDGAGVVKLPLDRTGPKCPGCCNCAVNVCKKRDRDGFCAENYMHCTDGVLPSKRAACA